MEIPDKPVTAPDFAEPPVFAEPWHAELFAMTVHLHKQGLFSWPDWTAQLS
ncbi:MAG: nitrile hydratase accessory protein, partial [Alphaproteobacteria bacterium]|nr:nitrile hydratase accessory protein [Alphaproteobacteria bacterium]